MEPDLLVLEIRNFCKKNSNPDVVKKYARYFKGAYDAYGVPTEKYNEKLSAVTNDKNVTLETVLKSARDLVKSPKFEETNFAIALTLKFKKQFDLKTFKEIEKWFSFGINNWAHSDYISGHLIYQFFKQDIITYRDLSDWIPAKNSYQRRNVPVSMIKLLKTIPDYTPLFKFIEPLMLAPEREVQQGEGWFLREAWKIQKEPTEIFLMKWKDKSPRLIYQYACEKMTKEYRIRFRREK